jgi:hypothetical protein
MTIIASSLAAGNLRCYAFTELARSSAMVASDSAQPQVRRRTQPQEVADSSTWETEVAHCSTQATDYHRTRN